MNKETGWVWKSIINQFLSDKFYDFVKKLRLGDTYHDIWRVFFIKILGKKNLIFGSNPISIEKKKVQWPFYYNLW